MPLSSKTLFSANHAMDLYCICLCWTLVFIFPFVLSPQTAPSVGKALEQFVKPEQLEGENAYKCTK